MKCLRAERKVWEPEALAAALDRKDCKIVLAVGCFDLLTAGHVRHLEAAAALGDFLAVAITCDRCVNKGPGRPLVGEADRVATVAALECVDAAFIDRLEPPSLGMFSLLRPDVYAKGGDYEGNINPMLARQVELVESLGGRFVLTDEPELHTTELLGRIRACA